MSSSSLPLQVNFSKQCSRELCGGTRGKPRNRTLHILHLGWPLRFFGFGWSGNRGSRRRRVAFVEAMRLMKTWTKRRRRQKNRMAHFTCQRESWGLFHKKSLNYKPQIGLYYKPFLWQKKYYKPLKGLYYKPLLKKMVFHKIGLYSKTQRGL